MSEFKWEEQHVRDILQGLNKHVHPNEVERYIQDFKASKQPKPEWEIMEGINDKGYVFQWAKNHPHFMDDRVGVTGSIHSVKRLSDNVIFSIGDLVTYYANPGMVPDFEIEKFEISHTSMLAGKGIRFVNISYLCKLPPKQIPVTLTSSQIEKLHRILNTHD
jgi:hypothetical protein